jgi:hypothetical protein
MGMGKQSYQNGTGSVIGHLEQMRAGKPIIPTFHYSILPIAEPFLTQDKLSGAKF